MANTPSPFTATGSLLGYLFQCRYAFLDTLRRVRRSEDFKVSLENMDDVTFEIGDHIDVLQTKHHIKRRADLSDSSTDIWKTLRVWCNGISTGSLPSRTYFYLVTTASASSDSAASYLGIDGRYPDKALSRLETAAMASANAVNIPAYQAFLNLSQEQRKTLVHTMFIFGASPSIANLDGLLAQEISLSVSDKKHLPAFLQQLEGWWLHQVISQLTSTTNGSISSDEVDSQIRYMIEQFKQDNLPINEDIVKSVIDDTLYEQRTFVCQLKIAGIGSKRILYAIQDYYRACAQRSRWIREDLLHVNELQGYERRLVEEWERHFEIMREQLGETAAEEEKKRAAQALYKWAETEADVRIRPSCSEPFVMRGSFQILAEKETIGWHQNFRERLIELLKLEGVKAC